jgi:hypothetical protein
MDVAKYRSAVWELFQTEIKYLCNQLQPLEQVYKAFLEELQFYGLLAVADVQKIFANLSELVELSVSVATDLLQLFVGRHGDMIAPTNELILTFSMVGFDWRGSWHDLLGFAPTVWAQVEPSVPEVLCQYGETAWLCEGPAAAA